MTISGFKVLVSGTLVFTAGQEIRFCPFLDDLLFGVIIRVIFGPEKAGRVETTFSGEKDCVITFYKDEFLQDFSIATVNPVEFAVSEDQKISYGINIYLSTTGSNIEKYSNNLSFTVVERPR